MPAIEICQARYKGTYTILHANDVFTGEVKPGDSISVPAYQIPEYGTDWEVIPAAATLPEKKRKEAVE